MATFPPFLADYTYDYPESLVAYAPLKERAESRLLLVRRHPEKGLPRLEDCQFSELPRIIQDHPSLCDQLLVRNRSKVLPARFYARRATGSRHEIVLTERVDSREWRALIRNVAKIKSIETLQIENSEEKVEVLAPDRVRFSAYDVPLLLQSVGKIPLPPYIKREVTEEDKTRYQTVWAKGEALSAAAPTASLHFTDSVWDSLSAKMATADVFLHVGRGTFEALRENEISKAELHEEAFEVLKEDEEKIQRAQKVFAIGTTACRLVESLCCLDRKQDFMRFQRGTSGIEGHTKLFIRPGYEFQKVNSLLTNFHLPESSLFVLVSVFAGSLSLAREAYSHAVAKKYRLFSYGDSSLWI